MNEANIFLALFETLPFGLRATNNSGEQSVQIKQLQDCVAKWDKALQDEGLDDVFVEIVPYNTDRDFYKKDTFGTSRSFKSAPYAPHRIKVVICVKDNGELDLDSMNQIFVHELAHAVYDRQRGLDKVAGKKNLTRAYHCEPWQNDYRNLLNKYHAGRPDISSGKNLEYLDLPDSSDFFKEPGSYGGRVQRRSDRNWDTYK